jgi:hypothetical protein
MVKDVIRRLFRYLRVSQEDNVTSFSAAVADILALGDPHSLGNTQEVLVKLEDSYAVASSILVESQDRERPFLRRQMAVEVRRLVIYGIAIHLLETSGEPTSDAVQEILSEMVSVFAAKNADYGNAFRLWGPAGLVVRIGDKYLRIKQLLECGNARVRDEKMADTAIDLANYSVMLLMLLKEGRRLKLGA